jgi:uncharacterized protein (UPF0332 family)
LKRSKEDLVVYRIQRAYESLEEAKILAATSHWNTVANRLYYACFYMVSALFSKYDLFVATHSGAKSEFHKLFVKTEIFEKSIGKLYSELFDKRQEGDYQDFFLLERDDTEPLIDPTEIFLQVIESHIKTV